MTRVEAASGSAPLSNRRSIRLARRWYFLVPLVLVGAGVGLPILYLVIRTLEGGPAQTFDLIFRQRNLLLLGNTVLLSAAVLFAGTLIAFPLAWLTTRTDVPLRRAISVGSILPLALPGYVIAYILLSLTGDYGMVARLTGTRLPQISGFAGATIALAMYTAPYLYLNLRTALLGLDPALEESARSLGFGSFRVMRRIVLPQLGPAYSAGALLVCLHVVGDFGVVSLMRFETFSYAIYLQYAAAFNRGYAAALALLLLLLAASILWLESKALRGKVLHRVASGSPRIRSQARLGVLRWPVFAVVSILVGSMIFVPLGALLFWTVQPVQHSIGEIVSALLDTLRAAGPAALITGVLAVPLAYLHVRAPGRLGRMSYRVAYLGYATPPLAFALAIVFLALGAAPWLYQTLGLLIIAYTLHFLAEALGPVRSALYQAPPSLEEAARSFGLPPVKAFLRAILPTISRGFTAGVTLVFLSAMKELPLTFILGPAGFETLAISVWSHTSDASFATAAPYALAIVLLAGLVAAILLSRREEAEYREVAV